MAPLTPSHTGGMDRHSPVRMFHMSCLESGSASDFLAIQQARKRRKLERTVFPAATFGEPSIPADYDGSFRDNVRAFLEEFARVEKLCVDGFPTWSILLEDGQGARFPLLLLEESMDNSPRAHCDHCRCIGWSHHPVSNRRYHFIVPAGDYDETAEGLGKGRKKCPNCCEIIPASVKLCACCGVSCVRSWALDSRSHLLHGVIHSNGFGHLLRINGKEKGSKLLSGQELMTLWDNTCSMLRARRVSVEDVAKKRQMELRLLHSVTHGSSWYARWGYKFGHGSYGITEDVYTSAVQLLRDTYLKTVVEHFEGIDSQVQTIIRHYQKRCHGQLQTLGDLFRYLADLRAKLPRGQKAPQLQRQGSSPSRSRSSSGSPKSRSLVRSTSGLTAPIITEPFPMDSPSCRWSAKRLELAQEVIVEALQKAGEEWVPRHEIRELARQKIGDTGLLDFVLKSLGNRLVSGHVVRRAVNPATKVLEFSLEKVDPGEGSGSLVETPGTPEAKPCAKLESLKDNLSRADVEADLLHLYRQCLDCYRPARRMSRGTVAAIARAAHVILDTKQFIKDYKGELTRRAAAYGWDVEDEDMMRIICRVVLEDSDRARNRPSPPAELAIVPPHATVGDLKREATRAFQDTYRIMRSFQVKHIVDLEADDDDLLFGSLESGSEIVVEGPGLDQYSEWRYEGGNDSWVVDCPCGAKDDDGERMIACDVCETWQHTRCGGISDSASVPQHFLCQACRSNEGY